jgi:hypothetical protein
MVGAKQLGILGLSWFRPRPYVQQRRARGTIFLCIGVPIVGRLQARRERRRGLQVPSGVIEAIGDVVGELRSMCVMWFRMFVCRCPCGEGDRLPFIDQGEGDLQACRTV